MNSSLTSHQNELLQLLLSLLSGSFPEVKPRKSLLPSTQRSHPVPVPLEPPRAASLNSIPISALALLRGRAREFPPSLPPSLPLSRAAARLCEGKAPRCAGEGAGRALNSTPCRVDSLYILLEGENMWSPWRKAGEQARPRELRHRGAASPLPWARLGPQDGPAETHQHHPTGPQSLSWRCLKVTKPFEKRRLGSKAGNT